LVAWEVAFGTCEGEMEGQDGCTPRAANGCASPSFQFAGLAATSARGSSGRIVPTGSSFVDFCTATRDWFESGRMTCTANTLALGPP